MKFPRLKRVLAMHVFMRAFIEESSFDTAYKNLKTKYGDNEDWSAAIDELGVGYTEKNKPKPKIKGHFKTVEEANKWMEEHLERYEFWAVSVEKPKGWVFAADIHV